MMSEVEQLRVVVLDCFEEFLLRLIHFAVYHEVTDGTTAIACIKERRHFIGFELSKEYFDKAVRRIKAEQAQLTLF